MSGVQLIIVEEDFDGQRLDRWFRKQYPFVTQGQIEKLCRKGQIRVDGGRVKASTRLVVEQSVRVPPLKNVSKPAPMAERSKVSNKDAEFIQSCVIYQDRDVIALNKPYGLPVQGGTNQTRHVDGMLEALRFGNDENPKLVHRLDKDTTGILLLARNVKAARALTASFRHRDTRKLYWGMVAGLPSPARGMIKYGLLKGDGQSGDNYERMQTIHPRDMKLTEGAKHAHTDYAVIEQVGKRASWVAMVPVTGRKHQLRAHMAAMGYPIAGDFKYGGSKQENLGDSWGSRIGGDINSKMHLHARWISIEQPSSKRMLHITAPLPEHMVATWDYFGWNPNEVPDDPFYNDGGF